MESGRRVAPVNSQVVWKFVPLFLKLHLRTLIALVRAEAFPSCFAFRETLIRHTCLRTSVNHVSIRGRNARQRLCAPHTLNRLCPCYCRRNPGTLETNLCSGLLARRRA